jgi:hypothetical protein
VLFAASACSHELDGSTDDGGAEPLDPVLVVRGARTELDLAPEADVPAAVRRRAFGPAFELAPTDDRLALSLSARDAWPADVEAPRGLTLVWLGEDGVAHALDTEHDEPTRTWRATLRTGGTRGHVFLAGPEMRRVPSTDCALTVAPDALTARIERCGEDQLGRVNELRLHLCAMGAAVAPAHLDRAVRELPCEPSLSDLQTFLPEALR